MAEDQTLASAMFACMLNAALIAVQGPNMTADTKAMDAVIESIQELQRQLDRWFAVSAGFELGKREVEQIKPTAKKIEVATSVPVVGNVPPSERGPARSSTNPFGTQYYGMAADKSNGIPGPDPEALALMERVASETLGTLPGE